MSDRLLVARVASASTPDRDYEVKTDGQGLSCPCQGWTQRLHTATCRAHSGQTCNCKYLPGDVARDTRTCRHTRYVDGLVAARGGLWSVYRNLRAGHSLGEVGADAAVEARKQATRMAAVANWRRLGVMFCDRIVVNDEGVSERPASGQTFGRRVVVVYVRADGWTLGAPVGLTEAARRLWPRDWVGQLDTSTGVMSPYTGQPFAAATVRGSIPRPRSTRPRTRTVAAAPAAVATPQPPAAPPGPTGGHEWLGGGRVIILRD